MNDTYTKFEFEIQLLHVYHGSNGDNVNIVSVYEIYSFFLFAKSYISSR